MTAAGREPFQGAVEVHVKAWHRKPASWSKTKKANAHWMAQKPDIDNVVKALVDAISCKGGPVIVDDKQIVRLTAEQKWSDTGRLELTVTEIEESG